MYQQYTVGVVVPAFNEAPSIALVVEKLTALQWQQRPLVDAVVVCDNGSTDGTGSIAQIAGAQVVVEPHKGYGAACKKALTALTNVDIIVFVDGDDSCEPVEMLDLLDQWQQGARLVIGSRTLGNIEPGSMTLPQRWGNWLASGLLSHIWQQTITDLGPFRLIDRSALDNLEMEDNAYGWTVEMQIKALIANLPMTEVAVSNRRRIGQSKVSGTVRGVIGAAIGILGCIAKYSWHDYRQN